MKRPSTLVLILALSMAAFAQERITLTAPHVADPGGTRFRVNSLFLQVEHPLIRVTLWEVDAAGAFLANHRVIEVEYEGAAATALLNTLNTANLTTKSLHRRVMEKLQADGKLGAGTFVGTPQ